MLDPSARCPKGSTALDLMGWLWSWNPELDAWTCAASGETVQHRTFAEVARLAVLTTG